MKQLITTAVICAACTNAYGLGFQCYFVPSECSMAQADSSCADICTTSVCPRGQSAKLPAGYTGSVTIGVQTQCNDTNSYSCKCGMSTASKLSCASGYYGTPQYVYYRGDAFSGCVKCPANTATCSGTTFTCARGYYKDGNKCTRCPSSDGVYGTTALSGATSITQCYIPSGSQMSDNTGTYTYTSNCYYSE